MRFIKMFMFVLAVGVFVLPANYVMAQDDATSARQEKMQKMRSRAQARFNALDKDSDGKISESEFLAGARERFQTMDANGDGYLSAADRQARTKQQRRGYNQR